MKTSTHELHLSPFLSAQRLETECHDLHLNALAVDKETFQYPCHLALGQLPYPLEAQLVHILSQLEVAEMVLVPFRHRSRDWARTRLPHPDPSEHLLLAKSLEVVH